VGRPADRSGFCVVRCDLHHGIAYEVIKIWKALGMRHLEVFSGFGNKALAATCFSTEKTIVGQAHRLARMARGD
jgi:hypothetical protein